MVNWLEVWYGGTKGRAKYEKKFSHDLGPETSADISITLKLPQKGRFFTNSFV